MMNIRCITARRYYALVDEQHTRQQQWERRTCILESREALLITGVWNTIYPGGCLAFLFLIASGTEVQQIVIHVMFI